MKGKSPTKKAGGDSTKHAATKEELYYQMFGQKNPKEDKKDGSPGDIKKK